MWRKVRLEVTKQAKVFRAHAALMLLHLSMSSSAKNTSTTKRRSNSGSSRNGRRISFTCRSCLTRVFRPRSRPRPVTRSTDQSWRQYQASAVSPKPKFLALKSLHTCLCLSCSRSHGPVSLATWHCQPSRQELLCLASIFPIRHKHILPSQPDT